MTDLDKALADLKRGRFVLVHDSKKRENETDMVIAAEYVKPAHVAVMRRDAGGLVCVAVGKDAAKRIGLPYLSDVLNLAQIKYSVIEYMEAHDIRYDKRSAFSLSVNHRKTFTGISDNDRALTIRELGRFFSRAVKSASAIPEMQKEFGSLFRAEGHVHLLKSSGLENRLGHTELCTQLMEMAGCSPAAAICEMIDSKAHKALTGKEVEKYAKKNRMTVLEGEDIVERWQG